MAELDLLVHTYKTLVPFVKAQIGTNAKLNELVEESSLENYLAFESQLEKIISTTPSLKKEAVLLFHSKLFIKINEQETISLRLASKAIESLQVIKTLNPEIDAKSCVDDLISNLDSSISTASIDELFEWSRFIKSIPLNLASYENFIPVLSIRIKSILWNLLQTNTMEGHINLADSLLKCSAYRDIEISDLSDIIIDQCIEFLESSIDSTEAEKILGNSQKPDLEGSKKLLSILCSIDTNSKENKKKLEELSKNFDNVELVKNVEEIRINQITSLNDFIIEDRVIYFRGRGSNGVETLIKPGKLNSGLPVCVKIYNFLEDTVKDKYVNEAKALMTLSGQKKCFLQFYGSLMVENTLYIVTELCEKTLAEEMIQRQKANHPYTLEEKLEIMNELLEGFTLMSIKKILHQDIKPANIMFAFNKTIKIIDFNVFIVIDDNEMTDILNEVNIQGTKNWMSPELLKEHLKQSGTIKIKPGKSDIFSLGLVFLSLFTFDNLNGLNLEKNNNKLQELVRRKVDNEACMNLIIKMLSLEPEKRPSFRKALMELPTKTTKIN